MIIALNKNNENYKKNCEILTTKNDKLIKEKEVFSIIFSKLEDK